MNVDHDIWVMLGNCWVCCSEYFGRDLVEVATDVNFMLMLLMSMLMLMLFALLMVSFISFIVMLMLILLVVVLKLICC